MALEKIDITKEHCPMTFVKVKLALAKINSGDTLEVTLIGAEPLENVPRSAEEEGHKIISIKKSDNNFIIKILKK